MAGIAVVAAIAVPTTLELARAASLPGDRYASQGNRHVEPGTSVAPYNSSPPTSGPHAPQIAAWGTYLPGEAPHLQTLIHNMEDGGVILWYRPGETDDETIARVTALEEASRGYRRVVVAPYEEMPTTFAATAWQRLQRFDEVDLDGKRAFVDAFEGIDHHVP
jgi:hypothetical protein